MKNIFLQRAGVKTEAQFLKKYQTEDAFFADHPDLEDYKVGIKGPGTQLYKDFLKNFKKGIFFEANNDYEKVNDSIRDEKGNPIKLRNALGKYQFVPQSHWENIQKFAKDSGLPVPQTYNDFLKNHTFQDQYFEYYVQKEVFPWAQENKGKVPGLSLDDLGYMYHHDGKGGANEFVRTGKFKEATKYNPEGSVALEGFRSARKANGGIPVQGFSNAEVKANYEKFKNEMATIEKNPNHLSTDLIGKMKTDVQERYTKDGFIPYFNTIINEENIHNKKDNDEKKLVLKTIKSVLENPDNLTSANISFGKGTMGKPNNKSKIPLVVDKSQIESIKNSKYFQDNFKQYFIESKQNKNEYIVNVPYSKITRDTKSADILSAFEDGINENLKPKKYYTIYDKNGQIHNASTTTDNKIIVNGKEVDVSKKSKHFNGNILLDNWDQDTKLELPEIYFSPLDESKIIAKLEEVLPDVPPEVAPVKKEDTTTPQATGPSDMDKWIDYSKQKDAAAEKAKNDNLLKDYFGDGLPEVIPENPNAKKKDNFPYMEVLSQIGGIVTGLGMANKDINYRDEQVNDDFRNYTAELSKLSQIGLRPEEEAYAKKMLTESYQGSIDHIAQASNGNRNQVLGNLGRVDSQYNKGLMDIAIADAQAKNEALAKYGEAIKYINEFDARRDIANNERKYDNIIKTKEAGANLAGNAMAAFIDSIHNYQDNKPGSWNDMYKSHMSRRLFNVDFTLKDDKSGTIPYTASWNAKQQETILAHSNEQNAYQEMFSQLSPDKQKTVNDVFRQSGGDIMTTYKLIDYAKQNNFSGDIDMTKYDSAKATGDFSSMLKTATTPPPAATSTSPVVNTKLEIPTAATQPIVSQENGISNILSKNMPAYQDASQPKADQEGEKTVNLLKQATSMFKDVLTKSDAGLIEADKANFVLDQLQKNAQKMF